MATQRGKAAAQHTITRRFNSHSRKLWLFLFSCWLFVFTQPKSSQSVGRQVTWRDGV
jgi:hypothetical protein